MRMAEQGRECGAGRAFYYRPAARCELPFSDLSRKHQWAAVITQIGTLFELG